MSTFEEEHPGLKGKKNVYTQESLEAARGDWYGAYSEASIHETQIDKQNLKQFLEEYAKKVHSGEEETVLQIITELRL